MLLQGPRRSRAGASGVSKWSDILNIRRFSEPQGRIMEIDVYSENRNFVVTYVSGEGRAVGVGMALISC